MTNDELFDDFALLDEVDDVVADLRASIEWLQLTGQHVLPSLGGLSPEDRRTLIDALRPNAERATAPSLTVGGAPPAPSFRPPTAQPPQPPQAPLPVPAWRQAPVAQPSAPAQVGLGNFGQFLTKPRSVAPPSGAGDGAKTLAAVRQELGECTRCKLSTGRNQIVFGVGSETASLVIIGEGPGANEDRQGEPFVGAAGQMLDRMLENVLGLPRAAVYITNVVKCRPPDNRNPEADEIARCLPFLWAQLRVLQPQVVLVLGSVACRAVFGPDASVTRIRGTWRNLEYPGGSARAMATFHPAYLLRKPDDKRLTFADLKAVKEVLAQGSHRP